MTGPAARLAGFAALLVVLFAGAAVAGGAVDPDAFGDEPAPEHGHAAARDAGDAHGDEHAAAPDSGDAHGGDHAVAAVRGLGVAQDGLRIVVGSPELRRGAAADLRFRIVDERGATVRDFDVAHERRMHLIVARRDLDGFQHLHPRQQSDGSWSVRLRLPAAGSYRVFADFTRDGTPTTLAGDLRVDGPADLRPLPAPERVATTGAYAVALDAGAPRAGAEAELDYTITRGGRPVSTQPYLGAGGHLVALREGDLAFLHVHPLADGATRFGAEFPTAGRYRLFLQFKHAGRVRTVAHTLEVAP